MDRTRRPAAGRVSPGETVTRSFRVTAAADAATDVRALVGVTVRSDGRSGFSDQQLAVVPVVQGTQEPLPQVACSTGGPSATASSS
jgi:hypothetical protein